MIRNILKYLIDSSIKIESYFYRYVAGEKLVIIRKDTLGDYIIFYPTIKYFKTLYPGYEISLVVSDIAESLIGKMEGIDKFIRYDAKRFSSDFFYRRKFLLDLKKGGYKIAIYPAFSRESAGDFMVWLTHAKEKIGFKSVYSSTGDNIYTKLVVSPDNIENEFDRNIYFIKALGANIGSVTFPTLRLVENERNIARKIISENGLEEKKFCIVFPGAGQKYKIWPSPYFSEIVDFIIDNGITPVICGSKGEKILADKILEKAKNIDQAVVLSGKTDLFTLAALLEKSLFYVGSDTGIVHLSASIGTPAVCIMGAGHFGRFFPYGDLKKNRIVYDKEMKCRNDNWKCVENPDEPAPCIRNIKVSDVKKEIKDLLDYLKQ